MRVPMSSLLGRLSRMVSMHERAAFRRGSPSSTYIFAIKKKKKASQQEKKQDSKRLGFLVTAIYAYVLLYASFKGSMISNNSYIYIHTYIHTVTLCLKGRLHDIKYLHSS